MLKSVVYGSLEKEKILEQICQRLSKIEKGHVFALIDSRVNLLPYEMLSESLSFKNEGFKEELEVRLVKSFRDYFENDYEIFKINWLANHYDFRVVNGVPRLYYRHWFEKSSVRKIFLGPKCSAKREDIKMLLSHANYSDQIEVIGSSATYR